LGGCLANARQDKEGENEVRDASLTLGRTRWGLGRTDEGLLGRTDEGLLGRTRWRGDFFEQPQR
jgi:hypothetical protein